MPINAALEVRGAAWALLDLRGVICGYRRHFRELLASQWRASLPASSPAA